MTLQVGEFEKSELVRLQRRIEELVNVRNAFIASYARKLGVDLSKHSYNLESGAFEVNENGEPS